MDKSFFKINKTDSRTAFKNILIDAPLVLTLKMVSSARLFDLYFMKDRYHYQEFTSWSENANYLSVQLTELKNVSISKWHFVLSFFRHISRTLTSTGKVLSRFYYILRKTRNVQKFRNLESTRLKVSVNHLRLDFHQDFLFDMSSELSRNIYEQSEWNIDTTSFSI